MSEDTGSGETEQDPNQAFFEKAERALRDLFDRAKAAHELHFAMALMPEFRGEQIPWKDFTSLADRGLNLFAFIRHLSDEYAHSLAIVRDAARPRHDEGDW